MLFWHILKIEIFHKIPAAAVLRLLRCDHSIKKNKSKSCELGVRCRHWNCLQKNFGKQIFLVIHGLFLSLIILLRLFFWTNQVVKEIKSKKHFCLQKQEKKRLFLNSTKLLQKSSAVFFFCRNTSRLFYKKVNCFCRSFFLHFVFVFCLRKVNWKNFYKN